MTRVRPARGRTGTGMCALPKSVWHRWGDEGLMGSALYVRMSLSLQNNPAQPGRGGSVVARHPIVPGGGWFRSQSGRIPMWWGSFPSRGCTGGSQPMFLPRPPPPLSLPLSEINEKHALKKVTPRRGPCQPHFTGEGTPLRGAGTCPEPWGQWRPDLEPATRSWDPPHPERGP